MGILGSIRRGRSLKDDEIGRSRDLATPRGAPLDMEGVGEQCVGGPVACPYGSREDLPWIGVRWLGIEGKRISSRAGWVYSSGIPSFKVGPLFEQVIERFLEVDIILAQALDTRRIGGRVFQLA